MKIRKSFVSNSSSCSFVLYGISAFNLERKYKWNDNQDYDGIRDVAHQDNNDNHYFGLTLSSEDGHYFSTDLMDDETFSQFKERSKRKLEEIFGIKINENDLSLIGASYYNG